jgi:hypothetical protein
MTSAEILAKLRRIHVDGERDWEENYDAFVAEVDRRVECLSVQITRLSGGKFTLSTPMNDVHYYTFELPIQARSNRFDISVGRVSAAGGESIYLVVYAASILPLVEIRWHAYTLDGRGNVIRNNYDLLDDAWLKAHAQQADLARDLAAAVEQCGWQLLKPELTEQPAPKDWPWPLPSYDYQNGEYLVRDYILKAMRDY